MTCDRLKMNAAATDQSFRTPTGWPPVISLFAKRLVN